MGPQAALVLGDDGNFYGTTAGWINWRFPNPGTVFRVTTNGVLTTLASTGPSPSGLVLDNNGNFYGTTHYGGSGDGDGPGTLFKVTTDGVFTTLNHTNGANLQGDLVLGGDGNFYGTTYGDGGSGLGTFFQVTTNGLLTSLVSFDGTNGANPRASPVLGHDGNFYGTTVNGGTSGFGTVFKVTTAGVLTTLVSFNNANGIDPQAALVLGSNGNFYGTTYSGGSSHYGTVFELNTNGVFNLLVSFNDDANGVEPHGALALGSDGSCYGTTVYGGSNNLGTVFRVTTNGVLTSLVSFNNTNGANPFGGLVLGHDGNFYGTTANGGNGYVEGSKPGYGTVFKVTTNGGLTTLVSFNGANGTYPLAGLVLGEDGNFYGTTYVGGSGGCSDGGQGPGCGTVFQVSTNGLLTSLVSFTGENGRNPHAGLVLGSEGYFYGATTTTLFKVTTNGVLTTLVRFSSGADNGSGVYTNANGGSPLAGLTLGSDGDFYGTTYGGGSSGFGTVFRVTTNGVLTTLVAFAGSNGAYPNGRLVLGTDGDFYGSTWLGGSNGAGIGLGGFDDAGTVFKVTTNGVLTSLVSFNGDNGANPYGGLVLGGDGIFYGTTAYHGPGGGGTFFRLVISAFTGVARQPGGNLFLTGSGPVNGSYRLWSSPDLSLPPSAWALLTSASFDGNGKFSYKDATAATNPSRFYQLSVP
jgi:uncharacterized repeat protein (TIGR03803 family)